MNRKEIQEKRKRAYFIEAAKEIVKADGLKNLTVKKIAKKAGYASGTLYNHFESLNSLLFYSSLSFFDDCKKYVLENINSDISCEKKAVEIAMLYSKYFVENSNIFQLLFLENLGKQNFKEHEPEILRLSRKNLIECADRDKIDKDEIDNISALIANTIHGNLLFYFKGRMEIENDMILEKIRNEIEYIIYRN
jgi:AcrR family transcriptional regulator